MTYKGKTVIRMIGKLHGDVGSMRLQFADGSLLNFKIYHEQFTEVDGGWVIEQLDHAGDIIYIKDDSYRHGYRPRNYRRAAS